MFVFSGNKTLVVLAVLQACSKASKMAHCCIQTVSTECLTCSSVFQEEKQQQKLAFERHLEEKQKEHTQLLLMNTSRKENMLNSVRQVCSVFATVGHLQSNTIKIAIQWTETLHFKAFTLKYLQHLVVEAIFS